MKTRNLSSLGHLAMLVQSAPAEIGKALAVKGIRPAMTLNGIGYFDVDQLTVKRGRHQKKRRDDGRRGKTK
jgi:hypothetical protein